MHFPRNDGLQRLLNKAGQQLQKQQPLVLYKKPRESLVNGIFQSSDTLFETSDYSESGFVFTPFKKGGKKVLIKADEIENVSYEPSSQVSFEEVTFSDTGKHRHIDLLRKGRLHIKEGKLEKVVLSRKIEAFTQKTAFQLFAGAIEKYGNALCYMLYHPKVGMWLGATPEMLLHVNDSALKAIALAGTAELESDKVPEWGVKEIEEQQLVTDFILESFRKEADTVKVSGPESIKAGKLWHLKSEVTAIVNEQFSLAKLLSELHPTPAVCGIPKNSAYNFILKNEDYDRAYYTGFLGELNMGEKPATELFVNLRCMKLEGQRATIYVGGGITSKSDIEKEWIETQNKSQTMLELL